MFHVAMDLQIDFRLPERSARSEPVPFSYDVEPQTVVAH